MPEELNESDRIIMDIRKKCQGVVYSNVDAEVIRQYVIADRKKVLEQVRKLLEDVSNVLDNALGDTDPDFDEDMTDEEIAEEDPMFYSCKNVNGVISKIKELMGEVI